MRGIRNGSIEHELRIRRDLEPSRSLARILDREPPFLGRDLRHERNLEGSANALVLADERDAFFARDGLIRVPLAPDGLRARGPVVAGLQIAQVEHERVGLARAIGHTSRDRERSEVRAPRAVIRNREMIAIVREPMLVRNRHVLSVH